MHSLLMNINGLIYLPIDATITENPFIYKLVPCQHFLQGICKKSDAVCKFSHGSLLPLPAYSQPQSYWYQVTLDPTTSKWAFESIPDTGSTQSSAISMATGLPLVNRKPQHTPSSLQFSGNSGAGVMEAASVGYPPVGRQREKSSAYQGRAKARNTPATHPQPTSGKRRGKKQLASRQGNLPSQATDKHPAKSVDMPPDSDALVQSLDSMKIQSPDSDASSVSSWASLSTKLSTCKPIPAFSRTNFPGLPGSENENDLSPVAERSIQSSESTSFESPTSPRGAWALGGPQKRSSPAKIPDVTSESKSLETPAAEKQN